MDAIRQCQMSIAFGYPGTGKTYIPVVLAADMYNRGLVDNIILTRPNEPAGPKLGFRPGEMEEKMGEWVAEILKILRLCLGAGALDVAMKKGNIEMVPFETMRGRSFSDSFVFLDEAQNTRPNEMKMFVTRIGEGTKVVVNGDLDQSDLKGTSGLKAAVDIVRGWNMDVPVINFGPDDIVRSQLCKEWILNWNEWEGCHG